MALLQFRHPEDIKKRPLRRPKQWKKLFYGSLIINIILVGVLCIR